MSKAKLRIESGHSAAGLGVRVMDDASGVCLADFDLDPKQVWQFLGGAFLEVDGTHTNHFDRVGKAMQVDEEHYGREALKASTYEQALGDAEQMAKADRPGWDEYTARRTGGMAGVVVTLRRWR